MNKSPRSYAEEQHYLLQLYTESSFFLYTSVVYHLHIQVHTALLSKNEIAQRVKYHYYQHRKEFTQSYFSLKACIIDNNYF